MTRILRSDSVFALSIILPTLAFVAVFGIVVYQLCLIVKGL